MQTISRRRVLQAGGTVAGLQLLAPIAFRASEAWAAGPDPATANRKRLVLIDLGGGNDGFNTVVPKSGLLRDVYEKVRTVTELPADSLPSLGLTNDGEVGLNPYLTTLYQLWQQNRVAIVQGVDYPNHNYSHFVSDDIWQSGEPSQAPTSGWLGRHLDRTGVGEGELRAVGIGFDRLPLALRGTNYTGEVINSFPETQFLDGTGTVANLRHAAYAGYDAAPDPVENAYGRRCRAALDLADATRGITSPNGAHYFSSRMLTARTLLSNNLGVEVVVVHMGGYDTHENQVTAHQTLMRELDRGIEAFLYGTRDGVAIPSGGQPIGALPAALAERTLIMTFSEFGRRIGDNSLGTDHGAAAPLFLIGPTPPAAGSGQVKLNPGLHRDHPGVGTVAAPADNLAMTTDIRSIYQAVVKNWIVDATSTNPDEGDALFNSLSGTGYDPSDGQLLGLFGTA